MNVYSDYDPRQHANFAMEMNALALDWPDSPSLVRLAKRHASHAWSLAFTLASLKWSPMLTSNAIVSPGDSIDVDFLKNYPVLRETVTGVIVTVGTYIDHENRILAKTNSGTVIYEDGVWSDFSD